MRIVFLFLICMISCGSAQTLDQGHALGADDIAGFEIPLSFDGGFPYVVLLAEADSIELFLDTGAGDIRIGLMPETIRALRLKETGRTRTLKTHYGKIRYKRVVLPEACLGGIVFRDLACDRVAEQANPLFARRGILGLALFRSFNVLIDYPGSRLVLFKPGTYPADFDPTLWNRIPSPDHPDGIMMRGTPEGLSKELTWCLDTGAIARDPGQTRYYNIIRKKHVKGIAGLKERDGMAFSEDISFRSGPAILDSLNFLAYDFKEPGGIDGFLGADFFFKHRVLVDFQNQVVWIKTREKIVDD
jgi:hypothetical protein